MAEVEGQQKEGDGRCVSFEKGHAFGATDGGGCRARRIGRRLFEPEENETRRHVHQRDECQKQKPFQNELSHAIKGLSFNVEDFLFEGLELRFDAGALLFVARHSFQLI